MWNHKKTRDTSAIHLGISWIRSWKAEHLDVRFMTWSALGCLEMGNLTTQETHMVIFMVNQDNQPSIFQGYSLFSYTHGCQFTMNSLVRHSPVDLLIFWHFNQFNHHLHYETHAGTPFLDTEPPKNQPESTHSSCGLCLAPCTNLDAERPSRTSPV